MNVDANYVAKHDKLARMMHMKIECATPEYAKVSMPLEEMHKNGMGVAHGGSIFALADVTFGAAANADRNSGVVSLTTTIDFLRPGKSGPLMGEARLVRAGGHVVNYDVQIFDGGGHLIARAMACGFVTDLPLPE